MAPAPTDVGSGPASSTSSALTGTTTGWTHTPSTVSTPTGGPYVSGTFSWTAGTTSNPSETITGRDLANNTALTTGSLVNDSTPPTGAISYNNGYQVGKSVTLTFSGADSGSGLLSGQLQRQSANFRNGGCAAFGSWSDLGVANLPSPYTDSSVTNSKCYNYRYVLTDLVGNVLTATSGSTAWVDYAGAVKSQSGVVSQLRLGDSAIGGNTTAVDSVGSLNPTYTSGVTLGTNGDPQNDPNTGVTLNGTTGWLQDKTPTGLPTGAASRTVEMWFKTSSAAHQTLFTYGSYANNQEFGLWIDPNGATLTSWGWGGGDDPTFTTTSAVNDGNWHQVVLTYNGTAISLYLDGVIRGTSTQTRNTVIDSAGLQIGDVNDATDINSGFPFSGSLDEFSVYNVALTATDVANHFQLGANQGTDSTGPTGGSVTPSGLGGTGGLYSTSTTINLALAKGSDASGVSGSAAYLYRATATLTSTGNADGVCGAFGAFALDASDPSASFADAVPADNACYAYQYAVPDVLGNYSTFSSGIIKVDTTPPTTPSLGFSTLSNTYVSGSNVYVKTNTNGSFVVTATTSDTASGIATYSFPTTLGTGWTTTSPSVSSRKYAFVNTAASPGAQTISVTNNAGTTSSVVTITVVGDITGPVMSPPTYTSPQTTGPVAVTIGAITDADSGVNASSITLERAQASLTGTTCGTTYSAFTGTTFSVSASSTYSDTSVVAKHCYQYLLVATDNLGNSTTTASGGVLKYG